MKHTFKIAASTVGITGLLSFSGGTALADQDKDRYTLFNPTPRELMREMSTDRPDLTESPYTVDAGHFQVEADLVAYGYDRYSEGGARETSENWSIATANLKVGLCNRADFQLVIPTYNWARVKDRSSGAVDRVSGFGDMVARVKFNLWGNDGGKTALGLMPFVKFPTAEEDLGNEEFEGGLIVPLAIDLGHGWGMGLMSEVDIIKDETGGDYHPEFVNTLVIGRDLIGNLGGYVEFFSVVSTESGSDWIGGVGTGLTYGLTEDLQLDGGINFGLTRAAEDFNPFVGVSWRF